MKSKIEKKITASLHMQEIYGTNHCVQVGIWALIYQVI